MFLLKTFVMRLSLRVRQKLVISEVKSTLMTRILFYSTCIHSQKVAKGKIHLLNVETKGAPERLIRLVIVFSHIKQSCDDCKQSGIRIEKVLNNLAPT